MRFHPSSAARQMTWETPSSPSMGKPVQSMASALSPVRGDQRLVVLQVDQCCDDEPFASIRGADRSIDAMPSVSKRR